MFNTILDSDNLVITTLKPFSPGESFDRHRVWSALDQKICQNLDGKMIDCNRNKMNSITVTY